MERESILEAAITGLKAEAKLVVYPRSFTVYVDLDEGDDGQKIVKALKGTKGLKQVRELPNQFVSMVVEAGSEKEAKTIVRDKLKKRGIKVESIRVTEAKDPVEWLKVLAWQNLRQRAGQVYAARERLPDKFKKANVGGELDRISKILDKAIGDLDKVIKTIFRTGG